MNFIFEENQTYISLFQKIEEAEQLFEKELQTFSSTEENNPIISNIIVQYNNILTTKAIIFSCLLRNGFRCVEKIKNNVAILEIETPSLYFSIDKELLKNVLQNSFNEVIILATDKERIGMSGVSLNDTLKGKIKEEYRKELREQLTEDVTQELRTKLAATIRDNLKSEMKEDVVKKLKKELNTEVKKELRVELKADVEQELRDELTPQVKHELKSDLKEYVSQEIKQNIEQEIRDEETDRIRKDIQQEAKEKTDVVFYEEQTRETEKLQIYENQLLCSHHNITLYEHNQELKKFEFDVFPLEGPVKDVPTSPSIVMAVKTDGKTTGYCSSQNATSITVEVPEYGISFIVRSKWTLKGKFITDIYLNTQNSTYTMSDDIFETKPNEFNLRQYLETFHSTVDINDNLIFSLYTFPLDKANTDNGRVPILIYGTIATQKIVHITDTQNETAVFEIANKHISVSGQWEQGSFKKQVFVQ